MLYAEQWQSEVTAQPFREPGRGVVGVQIRGNGLRVDARPFAVTCERLGPELLTEASRHRADMWAQERPVAAGECKGVLELSADRQHWLFHVKQPTERHRPGRPAARAPDQHRW